MQITMIENQQITLEMRNKVQSNAGAQEMDTIASELSNLKDPEFQSENVYLGWTAVIVPTVNRSFSSKPFGS